MVIKNNPIRNVIETPSEIKQKAIQWLSRIGVIKTDVEFDYIRTEAWAEISFVLNNKVYTFKSIKQIGFKENLKAIEIFLHYRVINIERGIEEFETAFKGYQQLEYKSKNLLEIYSHFQYCKNLAEAEKTYKQKRKYMHPDAGGNNEDFIDLQKQYDKVKEILRK